MLFCQVVYKELILGVKNQDKKNLKRVAWVLDVGHEDRTRIKSLVFAFAYFLRFILCIFFFLQVFYLNCNTPLPEYVLSCLFRFFIIFFNLLPVFVLYYELFI